MVLPDLQRHVKELNEALLLRNAMEIKMVTDINMENEDYLSNPISNHELTHRYKIEQLLDEMYEHDKEFYEAYAEYVVIAEDYDHLIEQHIDINARIRILKQRIARNICEYPTTLQQLYALMCQYGVKYLHNAGDVLEALGTVYIDAPAEPSVCIEGTHGGEYYVVPHEKWNYDYKAQTWSYDNTNMDYPRTRLRR